MFDGSLRPNAATDSNSNEPSWPGLKIAEKRRWETLLMSGSGEWLQSGKSDVRRALQLRQNGISLLRISGIYTILYNDP
jgi:hypothetical protein